MGKQGNAIIKYDKKKLIKELNKALADEFLAAYQYWIGAKVIKGPFSTMVQKELLEHSNEELDHAEKLTDRIIQLGGTPLLSPQDWYKNTVCGYSKPTSFRELALIKQNLKGERCAIGVYDNLLKEIEGKDPITCHVIYSILADEIKHEEDLEILLENISLK